MGQKTSWTLSELQSKVRYRVHDTGSDAWIDAEVTDAINSAIISAGDLGHHSFHYATQSSGLSWRFEATASMEAVTDVWLQLTAEHDTRIEKIPADMWSVAADAAGLYVFFPSVRVDPSGYEHSLICRCREMMNPLTASTETVKIPGEWITSYAAAILWTGKAAEANPSDAQRAQRLAMWNWQLADATYERLAGKKKDAEQE